MNLLFTSTLIIILAIMGIVLIINYLIISWESQKVDALASQIKHSSYEENSILYKSDVSREFTSLDLIKVSKAGINKATNIYDKTLVKITSQEYPNWINRVVEELTKLRQNFIKTVRGWIKYIVSLSKPAVEETKHDKVNAFREKIKMEEIEDFVDKVVDNNLSQANSLTVLEDQSLSKLDEKMDVADNSTLENKTATLNLASNPNRAAQAGEGAGIFEKLENRILQKMKDVGLGNYDLWLELGQLYLKYGEKEKAVEVFALVLKHTQDEGQKDLARNQLIGLN